jgi:hypothetical protein
MKSSTVRLVLAVAVAGVLFPGHGARAALTSGMLLTNFASATFSLPSGSAGTEVSGGKNPMNIPNSQTAWVLVTDLPQLCMKLWKQATNIQGAPLVPAEAYGQTDLVCFTISFTNCTGLSAWTITVTDIMPGNTVKSGVFINAPVWTRGTGNTITPQWATDLTGPWYGPSVPNAGQLGPLYLRWLLQYVGMYKSGYIRYCLTIL